MSKYAGEFAAHPDCDKLYVVDGMPFLDANDAENFKRFSGKKVEIVHREAEATTPPAEGPVDYNKIFDFSKMTRAQLQEELMKLGIDFPGNASKAALLGLLEGIKAGQEEE